MNEIVNYLESKKAIFHGAMALMLLYVPHAGNLFMRLEHIDMSFSGYTFLNWLYGIALAGIIEFLILVFLINGYRTTGKFYAVVSFFLNAFYYDYWFISAQEPSFANIKITIISLFICLTHSLSVWQLSELFYRRVREEKSEFSCAECDITFLTKKSLEGHLAKVHRTKKTLTDSKSYST
jgi:K+-sensing histidine kinase KdpD